MFTHCLTIKCPFIVPVPGVIVIGYTNHPEEMSEWAPLLIKHHTCLLIQQLVLELVHLLIQDKSSSYKYLNVKSMTTHHSFRVIGVEREEEKKENSCSLNKILSSFFYLRYV